MPEKYKFTWFDSKRSWGQFFKDLSFYVKYKSSEKELQPELLRQEDFERSHPIKQDKNAKLLIPDKAPFTPKLPDSRNLL